MNQITNIEWYAVNVGLPLGPINWWVIIIKDQICVNFCQCYTSISSAAEVHIDFKILCCITLLQYFNFDKNDAGLMLNVMCTQLINTYPI